MKFILAVLMTVAGVFAQSTPPAAAPTTFSYSYSANVSVACACTGVVVDSTILNDSVSTLRITVYYSFIQSNGQAIGSSSFQYVTRPSYPAKNPRVLSGFQLPLSATVNYIVETALSTAGIVFSGTSAAPGVTY